MEGEKLWFTYHICIMYAYISYVRMYIYTSSKPGKVDRGMLARQIRSISHTVLYFWTIIAMIRYVQCLPSWEGECRSIQKKKKVV